MHGHITWVSNEPVGKLKSLLAFLNKHVGSFSMRAECMSGWKERADRVVGTKFLYVLDSVLITKFGHVWLKARCRVSDQGDAVRYETRTITPLGKEPHYSVEFHF